jgi:hypothetical protein
MGDRGGLQRFRGAVACACCFAVVGVGGCGDDDDSGGSASSAELTERLVPAEDVGLVAEREFEWDNAIDYAVEGLYKSEGTPPSEFVAAIDDGFDAAAGEVLRDEKRRQFAFVIAAAYDSEDDAAAALDAIHSEDLKQPCFAACVVTPREYSVEKIPNSVAVHHAPNEGKPPPGLFPFEAYLVEFTIGSDLYAYQTNGPPGMDEDDFLSDAQAFYEYVAAHD